MRPGRPVIVGGALVLAFGLVFHLQGLAVVGPESSFMYSNPEWVRHGIQIAVAGAVIVAAGVGIRMKAGRQPPGSQQGA